MHCNGLDHLISRRRMLLDTANALAFLTFARRGDGQVSSSNARPRGTAQACIFINLDGAPSQLDTFDPKDGPWNPADADIQQLGRGFLLSRTLFPNLSRMPGELVLLHSMNSWELIHERGQFYTQTTHPQNPAFVLESPHIGSVLAYEKGAPGPLPPFVALNSANSMPGAKFLGGTFEPFLAPAVAGGFGNLQHNYYGNNSQTRFEEKYKFLEDLDTGLRQNPYSQPISDQAEYYTAAKRMMYNPRIIPVFQFNNEENLRYGNSALGRACLVARNVIQAQAGTSFINIHAGGWDTHQSMYDINYRPNMYSLVSELDAGVGNLALDLKQSGHLASTLIVIVGEFGRTPGELNGRGGRDHHRLSMAACLIGGGVKGGQVIGQTDAVGGEVTDPGWSQDRPIYPEDLASTIYSAMGVDWTKAFTNTPSGRRFEYVPDAYKGRFTAVEEVFG
ncbi:MAG: DUF1501 domain-containing protein [Acidobacteria bacterium]|nr:DUF1501 domain-containing protein [Acidobacteriota bacterium]